MLLRLFFFALFFQSQSFLIPLKLGNRTNVSAIKLTAIGKYGIPRKKRSNVPAHLHTGIDIKRPGSDYNNSPVFPITNGKVISIRTDGPYAQLILEHSFNGMKFWTLYEHVAGISVKINEQVNAEKQIARFMNKKELDTYGWQFDHFHLEILRVPPIALKPDKIHPDRRFSAYTLECYRQTDLDKYYFEPLQFLRQHLR
jgi:hypothetical protein